MADISTLLDRLTIATDVAFNNKIEKHSKQSYDGKVDIQFGIYKGTESYNKDYNGMLTINLKPSHQGIDWGVNFNIFSTKIHKGYQKEWNKYGKKILSYIFEDSILSKALSTYGVIISGKSKGAGEAQVFAYNILKNDLLPKGRIKLLGCLSSPKVLCKEYAKYLSAELNKEIYLTSYKNEIVTGVVPGFTRPEGFFCQIGKRTFPISIKDHILATTKEKYIYDAIENMRKELKS